MLTQVEAIAGRVGIRPATLARVLGLRGRVEREADVAAALAALVSDAPGGLAALRALGLDARWGEDALPLYLLAALLQVPGAEARHQAQGIDAEISRATLVDLGLWSRLFEEFAAPGLSLEILEWVQHYLRGDLVRIGMHQFEWGVFTGKVMAFRHRVSGKVICTLAEPGWDDRSRWLGIRIDDVTGQPTAQRVLLDPADWECMLAPGAPTLEMHTPADARFSERNALRSIRQALEFFARQRPGQVPACIWGKGWFLDPQVKVMLPRNRGLHWFQDTCHLFPVDIPEECTVRRFFGPSATRAECVRRPREAMNTLQRRIAEHLENPQHRLVARGGFLLNHELGPA